MKRFAARTFRFGIAVVLLALLASMVDLNEIGEIFMSADPRWLAVALAGFMIVRIFMALRWRCILSSYGIPVPLSEIMWVTFVSYTIGYLFPAAIAGDIFRGHRIAKKHGDIPKVSATIVVDRIAGLFTMIVIGTIAAVFAPESVRTDVKWILIAINAGFYSSLIVVYLLRKKVTMLAGDKSKDRPKYVAALYKLVVAMSDTYKIKRILLPIVAMSVCVQLFRCAIFYSLYLSIGIEIPVDYFLIVIPLVFIVLTVPISASGLGVREGALIYSFASIGVSAEYSVSVGLLFQALQVVILIPGVVLYVLQKGDVETRKTRDLTK